MPAHLTPEQLEQALAFQRKCWTHERIAVELGVHRTTVSRTLARHNRRSLKRLQKRTAEIKARQVGQLEWLIEEGANAWLRSKEPAETTKTTDGTNGDKVVDKTETTVKHQVGDPRFLKEARENLEAIRSILGIDKQAPERPDDDFIIDLSIDEAAGDPAQSGDPAPA